MTNEFKRKWKSGKESRKRGQVELAGNLNRWEAQASRKICNAHDFI